MRTHTEPVPSPDRAFRFTVLIGWVLLATVAGIYAHIKAVPPALAVPLALAFLIEYPFYLLPGFAKAREQFFARGKTRGAFVMALSAIVPWMVYAVPTRHFNFPALVVLAAIAFVMCFWYVLYPANAATDLIYLSLFAVVILAKVFVRIYPPPVPKLDVSILGHVMLIRVMALSMVSLRGGIAVDYRFWPGKAEWFAGFRWFAYLIVPVCAVYWGLGLVALRPHPWNPLAIIGVGIGTFWGILWVVSLSEEFIFRGLLQTWMGEWMKSSPGAVIVTSILFASVHLWFHGRFPNWRFSIAAGVLGLFCGFARRKTGGIQAGMIAHALTVAIWKMFLL